MKHKKAVKITILNYIDNGLVECELIDCKGKKWTFSAKPAMFSDQEINAKTEFPQTGMLPCKVETQRLDSNGKLVLLIDTIRWKLANVEAGGYFEVYDSQVNDL